MNSEHLFPIEDYTDEKFNYIFKTIIPNNRNKSLGDIIHLVSEVYNVTKEDFVKQNFLHSNWPSINQIQKALEQESEK